MRPGAAQWLASLLNAGFEVIVLSARARDVNQRVYIERLLCGWGPFGGIRATNVKPTAAVYVDDKAWNPVTQGRFPTVEELSATTG